MEARAPRVRRPASLSHNVLAVRRAVCMGPRASPAPPSPAPQPPTDDRRPVLCIVKIDDRWDHHTDKHQFEFDRSKITIPSKKRILISFFFFGNIWSIVPIIYLSITRLLALLIARNYPSIAKFQSHQRLHNSCYGACEWDVCRWRQKLFALEHMSTIRLHWELLKLKYRKQWQIKEF